MTHYWTWVSVFFWKHAVTTAFAYTCHKYVPYWQRSHRSTHSALFKKIRLQIRLSVNKPQATVLDWIDILVHHSKHQSFAFIYIIDLQGQRLHFALPYYQFASVLHKLTEMNSALTACVVLIGWCLPSPDERLQGPMRTASQHRLKLTPRLTGTTFHVRASCILPWGKRSMF